MDTSTGSAVLALVLAVLFINSADCRSAKKYMMNACASRAPIYVNTSLLLEVSRELALERSAVEFSHCAVDVVTDPAKRLFLHFLSVDIASEALTPDRLHIYDYNDDGKRVRVTTPRGIYGEYSFPHQQANSAGVPINDYHASSYRLSIDYFGKPTVLHQGFRVLLTVYTPASGQGTCPGGAMMCVQERICISGAVACDGMSNCGSRDTSDEHNCLGTAQATTSLLESYSVSHAVVAAVVACVVFLVVVIVAACFVNSYRKKHRYTPKTSARWTEGGRVTTSTTGDLERLYAPPSYESVVADAEDALGPPPDYTLVASPLAAREEDEGRGSREMKHSYSSVEVAILHDHPAISEHCKDSRESSDTDTREVTSDYVSRDSLSLSETDCHVEDVGDKRPKVTMVDL